MSWLATSLRSSSVYAIFFGWINPESLNESRNFLYWQKFRVLRSGREKSLLSCSLQQQQLHFFFNSINCLFFSAATRNLQLATKSDTWHEWPRKLSLFSRSAISALQKTRNWRHMPPPSSYSHTCLQPLCCCSQNPLLSRFSPRFFASLALVLQAKWRGSERNCMSDNCICRNLIRL